MTLAQLADALGVRAPSLYNHVAGLAGLRRELALLGLRELTARIEDAVGARHGDDALMAMATAYRAFVAERPGLYAATVRAVPPEDDDLSAASDRLLGVVAKALAGYGLAEEDALHAIRGLRSIVHGFASLEAAGGFALPLDRDDSFRRLIRSFARGLRA